MRRIATVLVVLGALTGYAPAAKAQGVARSVKFPCKTAGTATLDPILEPDGSPSHHEHLFAGNTGLASGIHDYDVATQQSSTCKFEGDTAGYWMPTLRTAGGALVPAKVTVYYDRMTAQQVTAFPKDFGMIWGYVRGMFSSSTRTFYGWNCDNTLPLNPSFDGVHCASGQTLTLRTFSPYCWDGVVPMNRDYANHVSYPDGYRKNLDCPAGSIVLPRLRVNFNFQVTSCQDCVLSSDMQYGTDHGASAHVDYWNTWNQDALERLVDQLNS